ncbi:MAG: DUF559 domain-containing protein [Acidimicrobiia bacterium]|nr:DUF559 domain-containing protein [Acidimicrobiia bacterium]
MSDPFNRVAAIAASQHGVVTLEQIRVAGLAPHRLRRALTTGHLTRASRGVYVMTGSPASVARHQVAACLATTQPAGISHRAAARRWGVRLTGPDLELSTVGRQTLPGVLVHRAPDLIHGDIRWVDGVPITTPARTLVDLGAVCHDSTVAEALEKLLMERATTLDAVRHCLARVRRSGRPGVAAIDAALGTRALGDARAESVLEARFAELCRDAGLPSPDYQVTIEVASQRFRVDFAYLRYRVIIEIDGFAHHGGRASFHADRRRDQLLAAHGWLVLRFTARDLDDGPDHVISVLAQTLASRSQLSAN